MLLQWRTLSEINTYEFIFQRKMQDTHHFENLSGSFIAGHGTTMEPHDYSFTNNTAPIMSLEYRLKQVVLDGSGHCSEPVVAGGATSVNEALPREFVLGQNYPNTFTRVRKSDIRSRLQVT